MCVRVCVCVYLCVCVCFGMRVCVFVCLCGLEREFAGYSGREDSQQLRPSLPQPGGQQTATHSNILQHIAIDFGIGGKEGALREGCGWTCVCLSMCVSVYFSVSISVSVICFDTARERGRA